MGPGRGGGREQSQPVRIVRPLQPRWLRHQTGCRSERLVPGEAGRNLCLQTSETPEHGMESIMKTKKAMPKGGQSRGDTPHLDCRYGKIGISAVVAALAYQGKAENRRFVAARQSVAAQDRFAEMVA
jgi:hypothetical protein